MDAVALVVPSGQKLHHIPDVAIAGLVPLLDLDHESRPMSFQYFIRATNHIRLVPFDIDLDHRDLVHLPQQIVQSRPLHLDANACPPSILEGSNGLFRTARPINRNQKFRRSVGTRRG
jgi:hypothetical protein